LNTQVLDEVFKTAVSSTSNPFLYG